MRLGSGVAVAKAGGYSSDWTPSLGTSICHGSGPRKGKKTKKKKKENKTTLEFPLCVSHSYASGSIPGTGMAVQQEKRKKEIHLVAWGGEMQLPADI